jgi:hypothetical protein
MRTTISTCFIVCAAALLSPQAARAQGTTTYLSNLGEPSAGSIAVGSNSWQAIAFRTGPNASGYSLDSIQLGMTDASGSPSGFSVMIYSLSTVAPIPGNSLGTLEGSLDPASSGVYTYTPASSLILSSDALYFIVLTSGTATANGAFDWSYVNADSYNPSGGWTGFEGVSTSSNGLTWPGGSSVYPQYSIDAEAIPEPSILSLFTLAGLGLLWHRRKAMVL